MPGTREPNERRPRRTRGLTTIDAALALISILLIVQMWLLTATLEAFLAGRNSSLLPGMIVSALLFAAVFGLSRFIDGVDREIRRGADQDRS
jgi:hypothetical protein